MKNFSKLALASGAALASAMIATPAAAQVNGIATSSPEAVIVQATARGTAYTQINTQYAAQLQQVQTINTELNALRTSLDTNGDRQVSQAEADANPTAIQQVQQKQQQADTILQPVRIAQAYVIEQLASRYEAARDQVMAQKGVQMLLTPEAIQYAPGTVNITTDILAAFNQQTPTVSSVPPAGYQPSQETIANYQQIQQVIGALVQRAAIQQAQQQQAAPAPQQPAGR